MRKLFIKLNCFLLVIIFLYHVDTATPTAKQIIKKQEEEEKAAIGKQNVQYNAPKWYLNPPDGANVVVYYPAFVKIYIRKAKNKQFKAQKDLASALGAKLSSQTKNLLWKLELM